MQRTMPITSLDVLPNDIIKYISSFIPYKPYLSNLRQTSVKMNQCIEDTYAGKLARDAHHLLAYCFIDSVKKYLAIAKRNAVVIFATASIGFAFGSIFYNTSTALFTAGMPVAANVSAFKVLYIVPNFIIFSGTIGATTIGAIPTSVIANDFVTASGKFSFFEEERRKKKAKELRDQLSKPLSLSDCASNQIRNTHS